MGRYLLLLVLLLCSVGVHALESLRVGDRLLVVGDSAAKVKELMGNPSVRESGASGKSSRKTRNLPRPASKNKPPLAKEKGEKWQYQRDGHITVFTMANGKIVHIEDWVR
jgi:hypothetical protein